MKQIAVKDIAPLFRDAEIRVCGEFAYNYNPDNPLDVAAYGNMCVSKIYTFALNEDGKNVVYVDLSILYEPVMCG